MASSSVLLLVLCGLAAYKLQVCNTLIHPTIISSEDEFMCIPANFPKNHVCRTLFPNHTRVMAPNSFQINERRNGFFYSRTPEQHLSATMVEFEKVLRHLTEKVQCSDKIATLLCFFYFPSCTDVQIGSKDLKFTAFPCRSLCEEVTALDSDSWGPYFQGCNYTYGEDMNGHTRQVYTEEHCVNETHLSYCNIRHPAEIEPEDCNKLNSTLLKSSSSKCNYRRRVNEKVFDSIDYNFAINCTVNSVSTQGPFGKEVINCTINKQFPIKAKGSCTEVSELQESTNLLISGRDSSCKGRSQRNARRNSINVNETYIIVGTNVIRDDCEDSLWFAHVVAPLTPKLNRFGRFIARENAKKCENKTVY